jgi:hypothetical protein
VDNPKHVKRLRQTVEAWNTWRGRAGMLVTASLRRAKGVTIPKIAAWVRRGADRCWVCLISILTAAIRGARAAANKPNSISTLSGADLTGANLSGTDLGLGVGHGLTQAQLDNVGHGLTQAQLDKACGDANTKPPEGLKSPKPCRQTVRVRLPRVP